MFVLLGYVESEGGKPLNRGNTGVQRGILANRNTAFDPQHPVEGHFAVISALFRIPRRVNSDFFMSVSDMFQQQA